MNPFDALAATFDVASCVGVPDPGVCRSDADGHFDFEEWQGNADEVRVFSGRRSPRASTHRTQHSLIANERNAMPTSRKNEPAETRSSAHRALPVVIAAAIGIAGASAVLHDSIAHADPSASSDTSRNRNANDRAIDANIAKMVEAGRETFRFDTFGDEAFWGGQLRLHEAIAGARQGGVGPGISPRTALDLGLKVDVDVLPQPLLAALRSGKVDLDDPASTLALLRANAVVGLTGFFDSAGRLASVGIQCSLCHSTVDNAFAGGVGHRLDGWANHDLDVGRIIAGAPDLGPMATLLGVPASVVQSVLLSWGPGKFDAQLVLDGKAFNPEQVSHGVVTGTNVPGATLIPNAFGLAGFNQHTWTGSWGGISYWNAFVGTLEMHGSGRFHDPRLADPDRYPIAARNGFADLPHIPPEQDRITPKLAALHFYQLGLPAPTPRPGQDFDPARAARGDALFSGKARCNDCHVEPLWTEPGWNLHRPEEIGIDAFQANRAPDRAYKTMNLAGLFVRENGLFMNPANRGRFYHDGRFATLRDVVDHYDAFFGLHLTVEEKVDLVEYLKSLPAAGGNS